MNMAHNLKTKTPIKSFNSHYKVVFIYPAHVLKWEKNEK